jgi:hypothetical protein
MLSMRSLFPVLLCAASFAAPAFAGEPPTVKVGDFTKIAQGKVVSMNAGDVACYIEFSDASGEKHSEMADFSLCEPKSEKRYKGKNVAFTYEIGDVLADECQGNPDCGKSKKAALIKTMKVIK